MVNVGEYTIQVLGSKLNTCPNSTPIVDPAAVIQANSGEQVAWVKHAFPASCVEGNSGAAGVFSAENTNMPTLHAGTSGGKGLAVGPHGAMPTNIVIKATPTQSKTISMLLQRACIRQQSLIQSCFSKIPKELLAESNSWFSSSGGVPPSDFTYLIESQTVDLQKKHKKTTKGCCA